MTCMFLWSSYTDFYLILGLYVLSIEMLVLLIEPNDCFYHLVLITPIAVVL